MTRSYRFDSLSNFIMTLIPLMESEKTIAHAFYPNFGLGSDIHLDASEDWTTRDNSKGINTYSVMLHEMRTMSYTLTRLGLIHSNNYVTAIFGGIIFSSINKQGVSSKTMHICKRQYAYQISKRGRGGRLYNDERIRLNFKN